MGRQVQDLIDKIKQEGLQAADKKSQEIETKAQEKAKEIVQAAEKKSSLIIEKAKQDAQKLEVSAKTAVSQAGRNALLDLKKQIQTILNKIVLKEIAEALTSEVVVDLLKIIIKNFSDQKSDSRIKIGLNPKDVDKVSKGFMEKLKSEAKKNIEICASEDIATGFTISFDSGKSSFEFTDESLAQYLSIYLNPQIAELLKDEVK